MSPTAVAEETRARKPAPFPHHYEVTLEDGSHGWSALIAPPRPVIVGGPPPEFGGEEQWWSPEHLLLSAASLCLMTTFKVFAAKRQLQVARYSSIVKAILDKTPHGLAFTSIVIEVELETAPEDSERALLTLDEAKQACIVANALRVPLDLRATVHQAR